MDPLSPKQLRELNSAYTSVHPDKDELSEENALQNLEENLFNYSKREDIIPQDTELTEGWKSKLDEVDRSFLCVDHQCLMKCFLHSLAGYLGKNLRKMSRE